MARGPLLRGWLHAAPSSAWLIGGPFLIAAGPDAVATAPSSRLRGRHAGDVRHQRRLPPDALVGLGLAPHAPCGSQRDLHRHRGHRTAVVGLALTGWAEVLVLTLVWAGAAAGHRAAPGLARCAAVGGGHPLRRGGLVPDRGGAPTRARPGLGRVRPRCSLAGLVYTAGALVYALKRPDPWPRVFGFHEVFHACTLVGAAMFAYLVAFIALPRY